MKLYLTLLLLKCVLTFGTGQNHVVQDSLECESYTEAACKDENEKKCFKRENCGPSTPNKRNHCYTLWEYNTVTGKPKVQMKGCFINNQNCYEKNHHCIRKNKDENNHLYFCCCNGNMCNQNFTYTDYDLDPQEIKEYIQTAGDPHHLLVIVAGSAAVFLILILCITWYCHRYKLTNENNTSSVTWCRNLHSTSFITRFDPSYSFSGKKRKRRPELVSVELVEKVASGKYGTVWKARRTGEAEAKLAVKVFSVHDHQSYLMESVILRLPHMQHENLIEFVGWGQVGEGLDLEYWLVTAFCDRGTLYKYLAENVVDCEELIDIALGIVRGLAHLHKEINSRSVRHYTDYKPSVAHRDFKSTNVLITADMRVVIADFGLALKFDKIGDNSDSSRHYGRNGTLRYMAPELLDEAVSSFNRESFFASDIYACGLVLWELLSRCTANQLVREYCLPFEREVGHHLTLQSMHNYVVKNRGRPFIPKKWREHHRLSLFCDLLEECWDEDSEARVTASFLLERMLLLKNFDSLKPAPSSSEIKKITAKKDLPISRICIDSDSDAPSSTSSTSSEIKKITAKDLPTYNKFSDSESDTLSAFSEVTKITKVSEDCVSGQSKSDPEDLPYRNLDSSSSASSEGEFTSRTRMP